MVENAIRRVGGAGQSVGMHTVQADNTTAKPIYAVVKIVIDALVKLFLIVLFLVRNGSPEHFIFSQQD